MSPVGRFLDGCFHLFLRWREDGEILHPPVVPTVGCEKLHEQPSVAVA